MIFQKMKRDRAELAVPENLHALLKRQGGSGFESLKIGKLADFKIGPETSFTVRSDATLAPDSFSNMPSKFQRLIYWQPPRPKSPVRHLAALLDSHLDGLLPKREYVAEHAQPGWAAGTLFDLLNTASFNVAQVGSVFNDSIIIAVDPPTQMPFLVRKLAPRCRLVVLGPYPQHGFCDLQIPLDASTPLTALDVVASLKHLVQTHTERKSRSVFALKGPPHTSHQLSKNAFDKITFVLPNGESDLVGRTFDETLSKLFATADTIYIPNAARLMHEVRAYGDTDAKLDLLKHLLDQGVRVQVLS